MRSRLAKPQTLISIIPGNIVTLCQSSPHVMNEGRYQVLNSVDYGNGPQVKLRPMVWIDGTWQYSGMRQPFYRDGQTMVETDQSYEEHIRSECKRR